MVGNEQGQRIERARAGDPEARAQLYADAVGVVTATARRSARRSHDVDDIVQEAFARAFASLDRLRDPDAFAGWVARIAANVAMDLHRHGQREFPGAMPAEAFDSEALTDAAADPATLAQTNDLSTRTIEGLRSLSATDQEVLILRDAYAVEVAEIARRLQLSSGATRSLLTRARRRAAVALVGAFSWLPAGLALRLRRWSEHGRGLTPLPMTATAAVLTLATVPLVDAVLHDVPAHGLETDGTEQVATMRLAADRWSFDALAGSPLEQPATAADARSGSPAPAPTPIGEEVLPEQIADVEGAGSISRRRAKGRDVGLVIQDADGNTVLDIGGNVPEPLAAPLRDAGLLGHEVVVTIGSDGVAVNGEGL